MSLILDQLCKVYDVSKEESFQLTADVAAAATTLTVNSTAGLTAGDYIILGEPGREKTEIVKITTVASGTSLTVPAISYAHKEMDPVYRTPYNQVKVYSSSSESGAYTNISGSPLAMEVDQFYTYLVDSAGTSSTWYKFSYYNSTSASESDKSSARLAGLPDQLITLGELKEDLGIKLDDHEVDNLLINCIIRATSRIVSETGVQWIAKTITDEWHDVNNENCDLIEPNYYPIYGTPTEVEEDGEDLTYDSDPDDTDYYLYSYGIKPLTHFTKGSKMMKLSYVAYKAPTDEIKYACLEMAGVMSGKKIRTFEDGSGVTQSVVLRSIPQDVKDIIDRNKRKSF